MGEGGLKLLKKSELPSDADVRVPETGPAPQLLRSEFVARIHAAVESGRLSLRKAASVLGMGLADFVDLCQAYGRPLFYEV